MTREYEVSLVGSNNVVQLTGKQLTIRGYTKTHRAVNYTNYTGDLYGMWIIVQ